MAGVRGCNFVEFETGWNLPSVLKRVTRSVHAKHVTGCFVFSAVLLEYRRIGLSGAHSLFSAHRLLGAWCLLDKICL